MATTGGVLPTQPTTNASNPNNVVPKRNERPRKDPKRCNGVNQNFSPNHKDKVMSVSVTDRLDTLPLPQHPTVPYEYVLYKDVNALVQRLVFQNRWTQTQTNATNDNHNSNTKNSSSSNDSESQSKKKMEEKEDYLCQPGLSVWVCKSKGKKNNKNGKHQQQRLELFQRAIVLGPEQQKEQQQEQVQFHKQKEEEPVRIRVQYPKGSTYAVKRDFLIPSLIMVQNCIVVTDETVEYRRACLVYHSGSNEHFLEIGCHVGLTVAKVAAAASSCCPNNVKCVGVDKAADIIQEAQRRYSNVNAEFAVWDILEYDTKSCTTNSSSSSSNDKGDERSPNTTIPECLVDWLRVSPQQQQQQQQQQQHKSNSLVVAMDINGNREWEAVHQGLEKVLLLFQPRLVIVKSRALHAKLQQQVTT